SDDLFDWQKLPASLIVVGTGIIALELGQALADLGVQVTFIAREENFGPFTDPELVEQARALFTRKLNVRMEAEIVEATVEKNAACLRVRTPNGEEMPSAEYVLAATGRRANLDGLMLQNTGLTLG